MPEALILEFTGVGNAEYEAVNQQLGIDMSSGQGSWPPGLLSHSAGTADDGAFIVTEVWASRQDQQAFMDSRLGAALAAGGITRAPNVRWVSLVSYHQPGT
jgi:heme-degrading monooxygenase HmoA